MNIWLVDAFARKTFEGNPAGVCLPEEPIEAELMQSIAMEMNQAETGFAWPEGDGYRLRWFTPTNEVELCGHATLATAYVLWTKAGADDFCVQFETLSGRLEVKKGPDGFEMDFPAEIVQAAELPGSVDGLEGAVFTGKNRMDWLVELPTAEDVKEFVPNQAQIAALGLRALIITAKVEDGSSDFVSRLFGPNVGIPEDPVTGSAHCALAPYWSPKLGKQRMTGYQASKRGGFVVCAWSGKDRVLLGGTARGVLRGEIEFSR